MGRRLIEAAVAVVCTAGSVLLMRRSEREDDPWSGHWSFPGGRRDPADSDLLATALRELAEECGVRLPRNQLEIALPTVPARAGVAHSLPVTPFVFRIDRELPTVLDPREAASSAWVSLQMLADPSQHCLRPIPGMPPGTLFPAVMLDGFPLWGFTYRLIAGRLELLSTDDGLATANRILALLLSLGLQLHCEWTHRRAIVTGTIPVTTVMAALSTPDGSVPRVTSVEVQPQRVRVVGLALEEYSIEARGE